MTKRLYTVTLPDIGEGVIEGEVIEWLKAEGDSIEQDEAIVVVMTDKATVELPAPYPGTLAEIVVPAGEIAIKDKPLYIIDVNKDVALTKEKMTMQASLPPPQKEKKEDYQRSLGKALATPAVRRLAKELQIDLSNITGSGVDGRITKEDLAKKTERKSSTAPLHLTGDENLPITGVARIMAENMAESKAQAAHFTYCEQVDATRLVHLRERFKPDAFSEGINITFMPFFIRALSLSLKDYPKINSSVDMDNKTLIVHHTHNIGLAMTTELGLLVPVLKGVENMSLHDIIRHYDALKQKAVQQKLDAADMKEATITISNFGVLGGGGRWATPVIHYPEVAIVAIAKIQKQPMVVNGELAVRDALNLSWTFDHRVIDGDTAAAFSHRYASLLQNPAGLL